MKGFNKNNLIILTGAPGSGKSSILSGLDKRRFLCVPEFAREIIAEQKAIDGDGLYDKNPQLFKELMLSRAIDRYQQADIDKITFFDRGIPDLLAYSDCFNLPRGAEINAAKEYGYCQKVFFAPSWEAIYTNDEDRCISFLEAKAFGDNLREIYTTLNYEIIELPCVSVEERIAMMLAQLSV